MDKKQLIQALIDRYGYTSYLELGCLVNHNFDKIKVADKTGVDIKSGGTLRLSTKQFFDCNRQKYDIIFIDADHSYESSRDDLAKSLEILNQNGCIILHDTLPIKEEDQSLSWNGEVWRTIVEFRSRSDLQIITADMDQGCTLVFINPKDNSPTINITNPTFEQYCKNKQNWMNLCQPSELINVLPDVPNKKSIAITTYATWGRIGHQFTDLLTSVILSHIFNIPYIWQGWNGKQAPLNECLPIFSSDSLPEKYLNHITIKQQLPAELKFKGVTLDLMRHYIASCPDNSLIQLTDSTFYSLNHMYQDENRGNILPGTHNQLLKKLRQSVNNICPPANDLITTVRGFIRTGGSISDLRPYCGAFWSHNKRIVDTIHSRHTDKQLDFQWYSQGPISAIKQLGYRVTSDSNGGYLIDFNDGLSHRLVVCDDVYPQLGHNILDILSADIAITGYSSFSQMTSILRSGVSYSTSENPFKLDHIDEIIEPFHTMFS